MGIYSVFTEDYRYKTSHAVAAYLFPPYTIFVGSYELYDKMANSKAREYEDDCVIEKRIAGYKKDQIVAYCIDSKEFR